MKFHRQAQDRSVFRRLLLGTIAALFAFLVGCSGEEPQPPAQAPGEQGTTSPQEAPESADPVTTPSPSNKEAAGTPNDGEKPTGTKTSTERPFGTAPSESGKKVEGSTGVENEDAIPEKACDESKLLGCFVKIQGGSFLRGAQKTDPGKQGYDEHAREDEGPVQEVQISSFWMTRAEVTAEAFEICVRSFACRIEDIDTSGGLFTYKTPGKENHPVNGVNWFAARDYCAFVGGRLPTEAEWEYSARGSSSNRFPWGDHPRCGMAKIDTEGSNKGSDYTDELVCQSSETRSVADARLPSPFDVTGMAGGVWEWVQDWYAPNAYTTSDLTDPKGPEKGDERGQRGGGWTNENAWDLRSAGRGSLSPEQKLDDLGFRCAWPAYVQVETVLAIPPGFVEENQNEPSPVMMLRPGKLVFPANAEKQPVSRTIRISNLGNEVLTIFQMELTGAQFGWKEPVMMPFEIKSGGWSELTFVYRSENPETDKGQLRILSNAPPKPLRQIRLLSTKFKE